MQRHDFFENFRQLFAPAQLQKNPCLVAKCFSSEKSGSIGSLQSKIDASQRFLWIVQKIEMKGCFTDRKTDVVRIPLDHLVQNRQSLAVSTSLNQEVPEMEGQFVLIFGITGAHPRRHGVDDAAQGKLHPQLLDPLIEFSD